MIAKTIKGNTTKEIETALVELLSQSFTPSVALVFLPYFLNPSEIQELFSRNNIQILGTSSYGSFNNADFDGNSIVSMLFDLKPEYFKIELHETTLVNTYEVATSIGKSGKNYFNNPAFILIPGGMMVDGELVMKGVLDGCNSNVPLFGGAASADFSAAGNTFVFDNKKTTEQGIITMIIDTDNVEVRGLAVGGWEPIGAFHTITKSSGNVVYSIDGIPALDCIAQYGGIDLENAKAHNNLMDYFINIDRMFQFEVHRQGKPPIMRAPLLANYNEKHIVFSASVPEGSQVIFSLFPGFDTTENVLKDYSKYHDENQQADAVILFSCCGRVVSLGPWIENELQKIGTIWGAPFAGFFTFGEFGPDKNGFTDFHNLTCSLMMLTEKNNNK